MGTMNLKEFLEQLLQYLDKVEQNEQNIAELQTRVTLLENGEKPEPKNSFTASSNNLD